MCEDVINADSSSTIVDAFTLATELNVLSVSIKERIALKD